MKNIFIATLFFFALLCSGCATNGDLNGKDAQTLQTQTALEQRRSYADEFSGEHYVWESWQYGTNRVDKLK